MKASRILLAVVSALLAISQSVEGKKGFGPGEQEYGYIDVRPGAHMFYWLYYTNATENYTKRPLVMWLQGGPGASSTSFGNFAEIGPLTADLKPRNSTWVNYMNVLLVDNPVGSGYSYTDKLALLTTTNEQIGKDLVELMRGFLVKYPTFQDVPFYVFCESYGGKMAVEFARQLEKERRDNKIKVNFQGVGLGDSWISPVDFTSTWGPYLYETGLVDKKGLAAVNVGAKKVEEAIKDGRYFEATKLWAALEGTVFVQTGGVDFYNILTPVGRRGFRALDAKLGHLYLPAFKDLDSDLQKLMDGPVRQAFSDVIPAKVVHGSQSRDVFDHLYTDFMKPVTDVVEELLNTTSLKVVVYTGQLDLIVDTPGTVEWVDRLQWPSADVWKNTAQRRPLVVNNIVEGAVKEVKTLSLYWINRAGHMVPLDNPAATIEMLRIVTQYDKK